MIDTIYTKPKTLFLIDGFGAVLSAFSLGVVLVHFEASFGMPKAVLYPLALAACGFALYDFICYFLFPSNWSIFLKGIALMNLLYCFVSIYLVLLHYPELTTLGLLYFFLEFVILFLLIGIEYKTATKPI